MSRLPPSFSAALRRLWLRVAGARSAAQGTPERARRPAARAAGGASAKPATASDDERRMLGALKKVLDAHPRSRKVFRHLALVERTLRKYQPEALKALPPKVTTTALAQLETLIDDWSVPGLTALRRLLAAPAVEGLDSTQPNIAAAASSGLHPSDFHAASRLQVSDASVSEFMRAAGGKTRV
jgi:hypothetical protein